MLASKMIAVIAGAIVGIAIAFGAMDATRPIVYDLMHGHVGSSDATK